MKKRALRLNMFFYGHHDEASDSLIERVQPEYLIGNPPHGLWGEISGYGSPCLLQAVSRFQATGIKVIGYITGGYEGRGSGSGIERKWCDFELNAKLIQLMAESDGVNGVFIDECSPFPDKQGRHYLKGLTELAHRHHLIVWGNTGMPVFDKWYLASGGFDFMNSREDWRGQRLSPSENDWKNRVSVTGFRQSYTAMDAYSLTRDAWEKGIAYCYISRGYTTIPEWIEDYAAMLRDR